MALTSRDETDLLLPLLGGLRDCPLFSTFLERLRRRTRAVYVSLVIRLRDRADTHDFFAGPDIRARAHQLKLDEMNLADRVHYDRLRPGRVYSRDELDAHDPVLQARRTRDMRKLGLADERVVRVMDDDVASAWLIIANDRPCTAADSALLSTLSPYVAEALRTFVAAERHRLDAQLSAGTLQGTGAGWMAFDAEGRLVALAPAMARVLASLFGHPVRLGQRMREFGPVVERELSESAARYASRHDTPDDSIVLSQTPRIEALLSSAAMDSPLLGGPALVAHCRLPLSAPGSAEHLAKLHGLHRREAELALLLATGRPLASCGEAMGLTLETTRNYSKRLYAKMGVRGQGDLVRAVHESAAMLSTRDAGNLT